MLEDEIWYRTENTSYQMVSSFKPRYLTISPGIKIDMDTGNVTIPENLTLDDASKAFWVGLQRLFPKC